LNTKPGTSIYIHLTVSICGNASCKRAMLKNGASVQISR